MGGAALFGESSSAYECQINFNPLKLVWPSLPTMMWSCTEMPSGLATSMIACVIWMSARLGVGLQGLAQGEVAYQNGVAYAKERRQGRALNPDERDPDAKADAIIVHPDVRRMLMQAKAFN